MEHLVDFAIVIALKEELAEFWRQVNQPYQVELDADTDSIYYLFSISSAVGMRSCVVLLIGEMGPLSASTSVGGLLSRYRPRTVVMIGICASLDDEAAIGDVVVATTVDAYLERGKIVNVDAGDKDYSIELAGEVFKCSPRLVARVRNLEFTNPQVYRKWQLDCARLVAELYSVVGKAGDQMMPYQVHEPQLHEGPIASGPLVVASEAFRNVLLTRNRKYRAIEMESAGIAAAFERIADRPALLVLRGISDYANGDKAGMDAFGAGFFRRSAMACVSLFLLRLIDENILDWPGTVIESNRASVLAKERWGDVFVGRNSELEATYAHFSSHQPQRIFSIVGEGGIGKTRLAAEFVNRNADLFPDGVFTADLGSTFQVDDMVSAVERVLGLERNVEAQGIEALALALRHRRMLLVLDNFESVVDSAPLVEQLVNATTHLQVLVTSREALRVQGEYVLRLGPLSCPGPHDDATTFNEYEAVRLFVLRAQEADSHGGAEIKLASIGELCRHLDGIPLGIELIARQSAYIDPAELLRSLQRYDEAAKLLTDRRRGSTRRHQSLFGVFESSMASLNNAQTELLMDISMFSGGASAEALRAVIREPDAATFVSDVTVLIDKSLVRIDRSNSEETRYTMLTPIREYALSKRADTERAWQAEQAHALYFVALARQAEPELLGPNQVAWLDRLEADVWNFPQAHRWLVRNGEPARAMELVAGLIRFWMTRDYLGVGRELVTVPIPPKTEIPGEITAKWWICDALITWYAGDYRKADSLFAKVVRFGADNHLPWFEANGLANRGLVAQSENRLADAHTFYAAGETVARQANDAWNLAICRIGIARALHDEEEFAMAKEIYSESLSLFRTVGDIWSLGRTLRRILLLAVETNNESLIEETLPEARRIDETLRDVYGSAQLDSILAVREERRNRIPEALRLYLSCALVMSRIGVPDDLISSLDRCVVLLMKRSEIGLAGLMAGLAQQVRPNGSKSAVGDYLSYLRIQQLSEAENRIFVDGFNRGLSAEPRSAIHEAMRAAVMPTEY